MAVTPVAVVAVTTRHIEVRQSSRAAGRHESPGVGLRGRTDALVALSAGAPRLCEALSGVGLYYKV